MGLSRPLTEWQIRQMKEIFIMKKFISALLTLILLLGCLFVPVSAESFGLFRVTAPSGAELRLAPEKSSAIVCIAPQNAVLEARAVNAEWIFVGYDGFEGWAAVASCETYPPAVDTSSVVGIEIATLPTTTTFFEDFSFEHDGLTVNAVLEDKSTRPVTGFTVLAPDMYSVGEKTVTIKWHDFTASYKINVIAQPIREIKITKKPNKLVYKEGEELDISGLEVTAYYHDSSSPRSVTNFKLSGYNPRVIGKQTLTVTYKDYYASFDVTVVQKKIVRIGIVSPPLKTEYYGDDFAVDLAGLELFAYYDNGTYKKISPEAVECLPPIKLGANTVYVRYKDFTASYQINVKEKILRGIAAQAPTVTELEAGSELDLTGLKVFAVYNDNSRKEISDYTVVTKPDMNILGKVDITIRYKQFDTFFTINIVPSKLWGDCDGDGKITAKDARMVLRFAADLEFYPDEQMERCDVNHDNKISPADARLILRAAAKLEDIQPPQ